VQAKGGNLSATGVVNWTFVGKRKALIAEIIEKNSRGLPLREQKFSN